jgi:hypothetical protein
MTDVKKLDRLLNNLPFNPYCTDDYKYGCSPLPLNLAKEKLHIQLNPPQAKNFLIFDIDRRGGALAWEDANLPAPNFCTINEKNGHAHLVYALVAPVWCSDSARMKPLQYYHAIETAYRKELNADDGYPRFLTKNPYKHLTDFLHEEKYTLQKLSHALPQELSTYKSLAIERDPGVGRNVHVFDTTRKWGYQEVRKYRNNQQKEWVDAVFDFCEHVNKDTFKMYPLHFSEIRSIARSIANWIWQKDQKYYKNFIERQKRKGTKSGKNRLAQTFHLREYTRILKLQNLNTRQIAELIGVSQKTISNWLKES